MRSLYANSSSDAMKSAQLHLDVEASTELVASTSGHAWPLRRPYALVTAMIAAVLVVVGVKYAHAIVPKVRKGSSQESTAALTTHFAFVPSPITFRGPSAKSIAITLISTPAASPRAGFVHAKFREPLPEINLDYIPDGLQGPTLPAGISSLPIASSLPGIVDAISLSANLVLQAPPGAGKTTAVPLALLEQESLGSIIMLEPRRIAARSAASRMASLLGEKLGGRVGYRVRGEGASSSQTKVLVVTEGVLIRRLQRDPELKGVDLVIFDEFHERSVDADVCLALCRHAQLSSKEHGRKAPKLLVMSATLGDTNSLQELLGGCGAITSDGRSFPVKVNYMDAYPLKLMARLKPWEIGDVVAAALVTALANERGDILAFLPGEGEIRETQRALLEALDRRTRDAIAILHLYGALDAPSQRKAIEPDPEGKRRVILATPIAESSLTIEGVRVVIDSGLRKVSQFDPDTGMSALRTVPISKASAKQRQGRAGRVASGVAYKLWSLAEEDELADQTAPEMEQTDLAQVALLLTSVGFTTPNMVAQLPWLTPPPTEKLARAHELLEALGALHRLQEDARLEPTPYAKQLAKMPIHPRMAHMLLSTGGDSHLEAEAALLASLLAERDVLTGGSREHGADLQLRLSVLRKESPPANANRAVWVRVKQEAVALLRDLKQARPRQKAGGDDANDDDDDVGGGCESVHEFLIAGLAKAKETGPQNYEAGVLLALAFPDRIAQLVSNGDQYVVSNGKKAKLDSGRGVRDFDRSEYLVAAMLDASRQPTRIRLGATISLEALRAALGPAIKEQDEIYLAPSDGSVRSRHTVKLGNIYLQTQPLPPPTPTVAAPLLLDLLRERGLSVTLLRSTHEKGQKARELIARVALLRALHGPTGSWPAWSEESLIADAPLWLEPALERATSLKELQNSDVAGMLSGTLDQTQLIMLEQQAPRTLVLPSGATAKLSYAADEFDVLPLRDSDCDGAVTPRKPVLSTKLQEWFGSTTGPTVGGPPGELLEVQLNLLSPGARPTAMAIVSGGLSNFWKGAYEAVRKEGKARYPKHPWPEDPLAASPTRLTKKQLEALSNKDSPSSNAKASKDLKGGKKKKRKR